jgi:hypothetical protein
MVRRELGLHWVLLLAASLAAGIAMWHLAPGRWGLAMSQGLVLGSALYFGGLHRFVMRESAGTRGPGRDGGLARWLPRKQVIAGLFWRAAFFLALAAFQAAVCFEWMPRMDVRFGYVIAATWLFALSLIDPPSSERERPLGGTATTD